MDHKKLPDDEEEAFRKYIVVDEGIPTMKQPNTKPEQMKRIIAFVDDISTKELTKDEYASQWHALASELNDIGPPEHNSLEWRRVWTAHKSNAKYKEKKRFKSDSSEFTEVSIASTHEQSLHRNACAVQSDDHGSNDAVQSDDGHGSNDAAQFDGHAVQSDISNVILEKINVLIEKQNETIDLVTNLIQWLKMKVCDEGIGRKDFRKSI